jgi:DNA-binding ferritin-like protein
VRNIVVDQLNEQRRQHILAILSNGGYLQSKEGPEARKSEIEGLNQHYDGLIDQIRDPFKAERERAELMADPLMAAGMRGLEKLKWEMGNTSQTQDQLQGMMG